MRSSGFATGLLLAALLGGAPAAFAQRSAPIPAFDGQEAPKVADERPEQLRDVGIDEQLGAQLDLSIPFKDETGAERTLGSFFDGKTPVIISPVYFSCPGLCNFHLNGLTEALKEMEWSVGTKFRILAISFDSSETPELAAQKKETYMKLYDRPGTEGGWHFLTGSEDSVKRLTQAIGFKYQWSEKDEEWSHASAAIVTSPTGTLTRYLPGIMFEPKDVRLAVLEAGEGKVGTFVDQLVLYCFQYNPHQSRYTIYAFNLVKIGGAITMLLLAIWLIPFWWRHRRSRDGMRSS